MRDERGQMTVELAAAFPVLIIVAVIAVNALAFFSECAAFDNVFRDAGQGIEQSSALVQTALSAAFDAENEAVRVSAEGVSGGHTRFTGTLEYMPTLFGLGLRSTVFGIPLPPLTHAVSIAVDCYKPGVLL